MDLPSLRDEINELFKRSPHLGGHAEFISLHRYERVLRRVADHFLARGMLDLERGWWWEHLRGESHGLTPTDPLAVVRLLLSPTTRYWFIASEGLDRPKWVLEADGFGIMTILTELHHFEYYIVEKKLAWMMGENHHGVVFGVGDDIVSRLRGLSSGGAA
jgi:hypothetical protein